MSAQAAGPSLATVPIQPSFYRPLKTATSFRLLHFEEALFDGKTPIHMRFSLQQYELNDCPSFIAISYVWGEPYRRLDVPDEPEKSVPFNDSIDIDGAPFRVSTNMWDALSAALSHGLTSYLWLDGCCINQGDLSERAAQVLLMGDIFAGATLVVGFLGPLHPDLDSFYWLLMEFMPQLSVMMLQGENSIANESLWVLRDRIKADKRYFEASLLGAFRFYYSCKWFQRAWIKQEVVLARKVSLICGRATIAWEGFSLAGVLFMRSNWTKEFLVYRHRYLYKFVSDSYLCGAFHEWRGFMKYRNDPARAKSFEDEVLIPMWKVTDRKQLEYAWLLEFVMSMRTARCSDPRDKVYAIHGLASHHCGASIGAIALDYTLSTAQVYTKLITSFAEGAGTLDFLILVEPAKYRITEDLPSWVPDLQSTYFYNGHQVVVAVGGKLFSGHDEVISTYKSITSSSNRLGFNAVRIDHIIGLESEVKPSQNSSAEKLLAQLNLCRQIPRPSDGCSRIEMLWRTLIHDNIQQPGKQLSQRPAPPELANSFSTFVLFSFCEALSQAANEDRYEPVWKSITSLLQDFPDQVRNKELPTAVMVWEAVTLYAQAGEDLIYETRDPQMNNGEEGHDWVLWLKEAVHTWMSAVRSAQTSTGRVFLSSGMKLGLASEDVREGDEIWFAPASSLPLILRPFTSTNIENTFRFISVAYVHDMMDGEAFTDHPALLDQMETLLCLE